MISLKTDSVQFQKDMNNITDYMLGYLEGAKAGKPKLLQVVGVSVKEILEKFIDSSAKTNPEVLQHVYEWYQAGDPDARLFDIIYASSGEGLSFGFTLNESISVKEGSQTPFYDKARVMEYGIPVTINPVNAQVLKFEVDGENVFSRGPVTVNNPGGVSAEGGLREMFTQFFTQYISQSLLEMTGLRNHFIASNEFKRNFSAAKRGGRSLGFKTGVRWISGGIR